MRAAVRVPRHVRRHDRLAHRRLDPRVHPAPARVLSRLRRYDDALAQFELGDGEAAIASLLHAMVNRPQATRILLGLPLAPDKEGDSHDHNDGVDLVRHLEPFLSVRSRASIRFVRSVLRSPRVVDLQRDIAETNRRWRDPKREGARDLGLWLHDARQFRFALERAKELTDLLPAGMRAPARAPNSTPHGVRRYSPSGLVWTLRFTRDLQIRFRCRRMAT